jgi:uncharacterized secreted protein with C-terminal beta-propeller domain
MPSNGRVLSVLIVVLLTAASGYAILLMSPSDETDWPSGNLPAFESKAQLENYLEQVGPERNWWEMFSNDDASEAGGVQKNYHSETNVQVSGVDEMDRIKTDGQYAYIASSDKVSIILAYPSDDMSNVSSIQIEDLISSLEAERGSIQGIYLYDDLLVVICSFYTYIDSEDSPSIAIDSMMWAPSEERTMAFVVDVSDPWSPEIVTSGGVSGYVVGTRMIDSKLYMITQEWIWDDEDIDIPKVWNDESPSEIGYSSIRFEPNATEVNTFTNFCVLDVFEGSMNTTSILTDYSSVLYVSEGNIYLTFSDWRWGELTLLGEDAATSSDDAEVVTKIFRLSMDGDGVAPNGMGEVIGYPLNQFSLDEKDGQLRIATCSGWSDRESMVFVLDAEMRTIGSLGGIAPNETIEAARFVGDTLYLVTFLQIDPLFVIDLSDPTDPTILGELVVPGFSSYLHPMDDEHLIGIGMENGTLKVSLYDVSDPEDPIEMATVTADTWAWSSAQWDHKAVLFDQRSGLLAIPVYTYGGTDCNMTHYAEEMFVYSVTSEGIELEERLTNDDSRSSPRGMIIENVLYTITTTSVVAWDMSGFEEIGSLIYSQHEGFGYWDHIYAEGASAR